jgi:recombination protein RecR
LDNPSRYLDTLIREFLRLPGIGARSASRLAFHLLKMRGEEVESMTRAMLELKRNIVTCGVCGEYLTARSAPYALTPEGTAASSAWWRAPGMC